MWDSLLDVMGSILAFFYAGVSSYGIAIIGLTVVVRLLLFPLTAKQARSMMKMQLMQPEIKKLQAKHKDDRVKLNEEVMAFYKENSINPLAGCLPLVAQMPIFFALFAVLRHPHEHVPAGSTLYRAFCGAKSAAECKPKGLRFLGMDLSKAAGSSHEGFTDALPYFILLGLVVITSYVQFKQTQARQTQPNAQAAMIGKIFPVLFAFISLNLPSGNVLYFLVSNTRQIGQQAIIFGSPGKIKTVDFEVKKPPPPEERTPTRPEPRRPGLAKKPEPDSEPEAEGNGRTRAPRNRAGGTPPPKPRRPGLAKKPEPEPEIEPEAEDSGRTRAPRGRAGGAPKPRRPLLAKKPEPEPEPEAEGNGRTRAPRGRSGANPTGGRSGADPRNKPAASGDGIGRAQPPGQRPKPKKRRR
jgi:YidC/Oxa1 family membrane protein insertase